MVSGVSMSRTMTRAQRCARVITRWPPSTAGKFLAIIAENPGHRPALRPEAAHRRGARVTLFVAPSPDCIALEAAKHAVIALVEARRARSRTGVPSSAKPTAKYAARLARLEGAEGIGEVRRLEAFRPRVPPPRALAVRSGSSNQ
jgi:hypothetical protein